MPRRPRGRSNDGGDGLRIVSHALGESAQGGGWERRRRIRVQRVQILFVMPWGHPRRERCVPPRSRSRRSNWSTACSVAFPGGRAQRSLPCPPSPRSSSPSSLRPLSRRTQAAAMHKADDSDLVHVVIGRRAQTSTDHTICTNGRRREGVTVGTVTRHTHSLPALPVTPPPARPPASRCSTALEESRSAVMQGTTPVSPARRRSFASPAVPPGGLGGRRQWRAVLPVSTVSPSRRGTCCVSAHHPAITAPLRP